MKIFIRADGGNTIGLGHVMRMLVLAKELNKNNKVIFLCRSLSIKNNKVQSEFYDNNSDLESDKFKAGIEKIKDSGFEVILICEERVIEDIINLQNKYNADAIITDSYDVDELYFNKLKPHFKLSGYVDDVNKCKMNVDFIINQNINADDMNYIANVNNNTKLFLGTKYCMLRDEFRENFKKKEIKEKCEELLLTLGGMDNDFNTLKILKEILNCNINIHVAIGSAFNDKIIKELYDLSKTHYNVKIYENANMSSLMKKCDVAISACGSTLYELCAMNVPTIGIIIADNQENVALRMKKELLLLEVYWIRKIKKSNICNVLKQLINDKKMRMDSVDRQGKFVNIDGSKALVNEISRLAENL